MFQKFKDCFFKKPQKPQELSKEQLEKIQKEINAVKALMMENLEGCPRCREKHSNGPGH
jgi:hypothetical protein